MNWTDITWKIRDILPSFEVRFYCVVGLVIFLIVANVIGIIVRRRMRHKQTETRAHKPVENVVAEKDENYIVPPGVEGVDELPDASLMKNPSASNAKASGGIMKFFGLVGAFVFRSGLYIINGLAISLLIFLCWVTLFFRPEVVYTYPTRGAYMKSAEERFVVEFDNPVDTRAIKFNISAKTESP